MTKGLFISFEGVEGCGKSTQVEHLAAFLRSKGREVVVTKEPGGTPEGEVIRGLLLSPDYGFSHAKTEILLFTADRLEHVSRVVRPALERGAIVICDRYVDSTYAYQHAGRGLPESDVAFLIDMVGLLPDITVVLDLSVEQGLQRAKDRAALDRFEKEAIGFHERVRTGFLHRAKQAPDRMKVCDVAGLNPQAVFDLVRPHIEGLLEGK
ncbi:MAG: dTMP kinase [bacterium]|nr:dTMP kinase [bacterium]